MTDVFEFLQDFAEKEHRQPYADEVFKAGADSRQAEIEKAKELLKRCYDTYIYTQPLRSEIENFLKE